MCGIAGVWEYKRPLAEHTLDRMADTLRHRGPDDRGAYIDRARELGLAHRRLSIIDLSPGGHQPMERDDLVCTYNGEIYNFREIREKLEREGVHFTTNSDTEVLLLAFARWGERAVHTFRGMFAFAIWNKRAATLTLCRDRAGVKPLYYYADDERFVFASELKAILAHGAVRKELDLDALALYMRFGYIPSPKSIWKGISKLEPGHFLEIDASGTQKKRKYWDIADSARQGMFTITNEEEALAETERILTEAFKLRMVSDVPVGVFLSGGIDSSLVTALLAKESKSALHTFTIGFMEDRYNEAEYAKKVAAHLGTDHHELYLTTSKAVEIVSKLPYIYDEPFAGGSAIPTFFVSEFARRQVTVALSADGGDELFGGYGMKYPVHARTYEKYARFPKIIGRLARSVEHPLIKPLFAHSPRMRLLAAQRNLAQTYAILNRKFLPEEKMRRLLVLPPEDGYVDVYLKHFEELADLDPILQLQIYDFKVNLTDDILTKVDRASMAVSLESREPFLDPLVLEHAIRLPVSLKWKYSREKYLLKQILYKYVPRELLDRPKHGFSMPLRTLLAQAPRNLIAEYLADKRIRSEGILDPEAVAREKRDFLSGAGSERGIWRLIVFQMWRERWGE